MVGPEERAEVRLRRRAASHLTSLGAILASLTPDNIPEWEDEIADLLGDMCFNIRRLVEIGHYHSVTKAVSIGSIGGQETATLWDVVNSGCHLQSVHCLWKAINGKLLSELLLIVLHSDRRSIGVPPQELFRSCRDLINSEPRPHFGEFPSEIVSDTGEKDSEGKPIVHCLIRSRSNAIVRDGSFWTTLATTAPGAAS
jgi:hypothetical protein